jgi:hypothetical protein
MLFRQHQVRFECAHHGRESQKTTGFEREEERSFEREFGRMPEAIAHLTVSAGQNLSGFKRA